jgi:hypothetical protein
MATYDFAQTKNCARQLKQLAILVVKVILNFAP